MRTAIRLSMISLAILAWAGCDLFLPSEGYHEQPCRSDDSCAEGLTCVAMQCQRAGQIWYIDPNAMLPNQRDGRSWPTAYAHPQDALDLAEDGDQLWVVATRYVRRSPNDASLVRLAPGVEVYSGFQGGETALDQRDQVARRAVLDCASGCAHVVLGADRASLDGFELVGGLAQGGSADDQSGAGFFISHVSTAKVHDCIFRSNSASFGAGLFARAIGDRLEVRDCSFRSNTATTTGGGMHVESSPGADIVIERTWFHDNNGDASGGGVFVGVDSRVEVVNSVFTNNDANVGAGLRAEGSVSLVNSSFSFNLARFSGGGVSLATGQGSRLVNTVLWGDSAPNRVEIDISAGSDPTIAYCCVQGGFASGGQVITGDPLFMNPAAGDLRLRIGSSCIDTGTNDHAEVGVPNEDMDGNPRPQPSNGSVDVGAFEMAQ
jgi:hypothetical protein